MTRRLFGIIVVIALAHIVPCLAGNLPESFVYLKDVAPNIRQDIRYGTRFNFSGDVVPGYDRAECILTERAAEALINVEHHLNQEGLGLKVYDCYRPVSSVKFFRSWVAGSNESRLKHVFYPQVNKRDLSLFGYIASRSAHSRGSTVDVGLVRVGDAEFATPSDSGACDGPMQSRPLESSLDMGTSFDCFSQKSSFSSRDVSTKAVDNREKLRNVMEEYGFRGYGKEWWHFTLASEPFPNKDFDFPVR